MWHTSAKSKNLGPDGPDHTTPTELTAGSVFDMVVVCVISELHVIDENMYDDGLMCCWFEICNML